MSFNNKLITTLIRPFEDTVEDKPYRDEALKTTKNKKQIIVWVENSFSKMLEIRSVSNLGFVSDFGIFA